VAKNDASIDRGIAALRRAEGAIVSLPSVLKKVEETSSAAHLVPPQPGEQAKLIKGQAYVVGGRRWAQLKKIQARRAADTSGIRDTWKGAIAGQIFGEIRQSFKAAGFDAPKLGDVKVH
jgi:hypothetical protein